ncbi:MAG: hypothetical protein D6806_13635, partial [Deltaproteobacteria bacterium]
MPPCDDGNACTVGEMCSDGSCTGGEPVYCDDGNPCTDDDCDPARGCVYTNNSAPCDDGQACSTNDHCVDGVCKGDSEADCDDGNPCTTDRCDDALGCLHVNNAAPCDDGNACTAGDRCQGGQCMGGEQVICDDGNACTTDTCDEQAGCLHENNNDPCDDGDACTMQDTCSQGTCRGVPLDSDGDGFVAAGCPGGNDCCDSGDESSPGCSQANAAQINPNAFEGSSSAGTCSDGIDNDCDGQVDSSDTGCQACNTNSDCDDGNPCNGDEQCAGGQCQSGTPPNCDDGNPCTADSCDPSIGCVSTPDDSATCSHPDPCIVNDRCQDGVCVGDPEDQDNDGHGNEACGGDDCDDQHADTYPGAPELCGDGRDNNCNYLADENCAGCSQVDPAAELVIDSDSPAAAYRMDANDEAVSLFVAEPLNYTMMQATAAFYDLNCGSGGDSGNYSLHVYQDQDGQPGQELSSS